MHSTTGETQKNLIRKRANWARDSNEPRLAAEMFIASGDYEKAVNLLIEYDWIDVYVLPLTICVIYAIETSDSATFSLLSF